MILTGNVSIIFFVKNISTQMEFETQERKKHEIFNKKT